MALTLNAQVGYIQTTEALTIDPDGSELAFDDLGPILDRAQSQTDPTTGLTTTYSIQQPDGNNQRLTVGETFQVVQTITDGTGAVVGTPVPTTYTTVGFGLFYDAEENSADALIATGPGGGTFFFFLNNDPPTAADAPTGFLQADPVGFDFESGDPLCFARGTMILTPDGPRAIEDLAAGDMVITRDHGSQPIRWMGRRVVRAVELRRNPNFRPIRIAAGALGRNTPSADLVVSPQHRILVRSTIAQRMFGTIEVLVAAKQLLQVEGVDICTDLPSVEYFHMLFDRHQVVYANGAAAESLFTGPEALKSVGAAAIDEILALFPELRTTAQPPDPARLLASGRMGRRMVVRHVQNRKPLVH